MLTSPHLMRTMGLKFARSILDAEKLDAEQKLWRAVVVNALEDSMIIQSDRKASLLKIFAHALKNLDIKFAWIVNSEDGLDEISPYAKTNVIQLKDGVISEIIIDPNKLNINADKFKNLIGNDAAFNADRMINIFKGEDNDFSKAVCLNAAAGLVVNETHQNFDKAYDDARKHILSGQTFKQLEKIQNG